MNTLRMIEIMASLSAIEIQRHRDGRWECELSGHVSYADSFEAVIACACARVVGDINAELTENLSRAHREFGGQEKEAFARVFVRQVQRPLKDVGFFELPGTRCLDESEVRTAIGLDAGCE